MSARYLYRMMRHYERESRRLTRLAASNEYSSRADDRFAADLQAEDADVCDELARDLREELGL